MLLLKHRLIKNKFFYKNIKEGGEKMEKMITSSIASVFVFLAGVVTGILFSIKETAFAESLREMSPIMFFPTIFYVIVAISMIGIAVLLSRAAKRLG